MHEDYDIRQEQLNKASIMSSKSFLEKLLDMFKAHVVRHVASPSILLSLLSNNYVDP